MAKDIVVVSSSVRTNLSCYCYEVQYVFKFRGLTYIYPLFLVKSCFTVCLSFLQQHPYFEDVLRMSWKQCEVFYTPCIATTRTRGGNVKQKVETKNYCHRHVFTLVEKLLKQLKVFVVLDFWETYLRLETLGINWMNKSNYALFILKQYL